jgi:hypothetical protein
MEVGICCRYVCLFEGEWGTGDIEPYLGYGCQKVFLGSYTYETRYLL